MKNFIMITNEERQRVRNAIKREERKTRKFLSERRKKELKMQEEFIKKTGERMFKDLKINKRSINKIVQDYIQKENNFEREMTIKDKTYEITKVKYLIYYIEDKYKINILRSHYDKAIEIS